MIKLAIEMKIWYNIRAIRTDAFVAVGPIVKWVEASVTLRRK